MLYRLLGTAPLTVLSVDPNVLDLPGVIVSDRNAASGTARFRPAAEGIAALDESEVYARWWNDSRDAMQKRCTEVLVPERIDLSMISHTYVPDDDAARALESTVGAEVLEIRVTSDPLLSGTAVITDVRKGNLLESQAQTLVNTVNTVGVMGKGVALEFKKRFPGMFKDYEARCESGLVRLGEPSSTARCSRRGSSTSPRRGIGGLCPRLSDIERGLEYLAEHLEEWGVESLAAPPLGCGHGQLEWAVVGPTIYRHLDQLPLPVELYAPHEVPDEQATIDFLAGGTQSSEPAGSFVKPAWVAIAEAVRRVNDEPFGWPIGRTRFQNLCTSRRPQGSTPTWRLAKGATGPSRMS